MILGWYACTSDEKPEDKSKENKKDSVLPKNDTLNAKIGIEIINKDFQTGDPADPKDIKEYNVMVYNLTNNTNKNIRGIEADVMINNKINGNEVKKVKVYYEGNIPAGGTVGYKALYPYNKFSDKDIALKNVDLKDIKYDSSVLIIMYTDGVKETINNQF
jgi:hypothetical protein